jgi:hypothetical protein
LVFALSATTGCSTDHKDVTRWAQTEHGPRKLAAVLQHDKYENDLRVAAAMSLITMKPRKGKSIGIDLMLSTLATLSPQVRARVLDGLVPALAEILRAPPPESIAQGDPSVQPKDAAFELLTHEDPVLVENVASRETLKAALIGWALADFWRRIDSPGQKVSLEQMIKQLGPEAARGLPKLLKPDSDKLDRLAALIAEVGDAPTKESTSTQLAAVAADVASKAWLERKTPELNEANKTSGLVVNPDALQKQLLQYQEETLFRVFGSIKRIGGAASVDFLLAFAQEARAEKQRATALAALQGNLASATPKQLGLILALAQDDATPDLVRDLALRCVSELPRAQVIEPLYGLFSNKNWKVRWAAAEHILKMSEAKHLPDFMAHLGKIEDMAITEALRYGTLISELKGEPSPASTIDEFAKSTERPVVRVTALGYYYAVGSAKDLAKVERYSADLEPVPSCAENAQDCEWKCAAKAVATVGDYIEFCVKPEMIGRKSPDTAQAGSDPEGGSAKASQAEGNPR